jgi:hypothetical protein
LSRHLRLHYNAGLRCPDAISPRSAPSRASTCPAHRLSAAAGEIDRSFPISVLDTVAHGRLAALRLILGASVAMRAGARAMRWRRWAARLRAIAASARCRRAVPARAVRARAAAGCAGDPARRALQRHRPAHHRRPARADAPLARRGAHAHRRAARPGPGAQHFPTLLLARRCVAWGPTAQVLQAPEPVAGARWPRPGTSTPSRREAACRRHRPRLTARDLCLYELLLQPFADYGFMRRALVATRRAGAGQRAHRRFLMLRRMSLMGDAMAHAMLPGWRVAFLWAGFSLTAMSHRRLRRRAGVALAAGWVTRLTRRCARTPASPPST